MVYGSAKGRQRALARPSLPGAPGCKAGPPEREHLGSRSPAAHVFRASASDRSHARPMTHLGPSAQHKAHNPKTCARLPSSHPRAQCRNKSRACRKVFRPPAPSSAACCRAAPHAVGGVHTSSLEGARGVLTETIDAAARCHQKGRSAPQGPTDSTAGRPPRDAPRGPPNSHAARVGDVLCGATSAAIVGGRPGGGRGAAASDPKGERARAATEVISPL